MVDQILHPNKEHNEKLLELQSDGEETKVVEESIELNVDPQIPKIDEMITPEIAQTQPESDEIPKGLATKSSLRFTPKKALFFALFCAMSSALCERIFLKRGRIGKYVLMRERNSKPPQKR